MRRKLICLMLCLVALMTLAFTGCSGEAEETGSEDKQQSARTPVTVNMWLVSEKAVDAEMIAVGGFGINARVIARISIIAAQKLFLIMRSFPK